MAIGNIFRKGKLGYIGLDISDSSLTAVQLSGISGAKKYKIFGWSRVALQPGVVDKGRIMKPEIFIESLRQLLSSPSFGQLDSHHVILSIPEHQCYHMNFALKRVSTIGLFQRIQQEALNRMPFSLNEVFWDWQASGEEKATFYIYAIAVAKEVMDEYLKVFQSMGLKMAAAEPQVISASRFLFETPSIEDPTIYIDIGSDETSIATIDDLQVHQSSVIQTGAKIWEKELAIKLKTDPEKIAKILRAIGLRKIKHDKVETIHESLLEGVKAISKEARQHISFYNSQKHLQPKIIKNLILSGGGAAIPGFAEALAKDLKLILHLSTPWVALSPPLQPVDLLLLTNAIGAAIRGVKTSESNREEINILLTRRELTKKKKRWFKKKKK